MTGTVHVVVTGLRLKAALYAPLFGYHAVRSMAQARREPSCRFAEARTVDGFHHTLTVWDSAAAAAAYGQSGAHRAAAAVFSKIATGAVYHGDARQRPEWTEALSLWRSRGVAV